MNAQEYLTYFKGIVESENPAAPYDQAEYKAYATMNWTRSQRWMKNGKLNEQLVDKIKAIASPQVWLIISEPWCGDAAHTIPFFIMLAELNPLIQVQIELRDSEPYSINQYLTNGGKSIPKVVIRNEQGHDLAVWGPRPAGCAEVFKTLKEQEADFDTIKTEIQKWYNADKGVQLQQEILALLS